MTAYAYWRIFLTVKRLSLKAARKLANLTQDQLAAKSGLDQTTISSLETGRKCNPSFTTVMKLSRALGIPPEALKFESPAEAVAS